MLQGVGNEQQVHGRVASGTGAVVLHQQCDAAGDHRPEGRADAQQRDAGQRHQEGQRGGIAVGLVLQRRSQAAGQRPYLMDLNLQTANRVSVVCVYLLAAALLGAFLHAASLAAALLPALALLWLNRDLYRFFVRRRGWGFTLRAVLLHWLYYLYNGVSFTLGTLAYLLDGAPRAASDGTWLRGEGR